MNNKSAYILTSGFPNGFTEEFTDQVRKNTERPERLVYIAADFHGKDEENDLYCEQCKKSFEKIGINFSDIFIIDGRAGAKESREAAANADIIWISGGHPIRQIKNINNYGLPQVLQKSNALLIGESAGAINMAVRVVLPKRSFIPELSLYYGIGLVDINIEPHLDPNDENHVAQIKEAASLARIYGLFDDSFITVKDGVAEFYGDYIIYG